MPFADTFSDELLAWYDKQCRELPWRSDPTPYRVLVSESMLQQTQVSTVIPYFHRFMTRFPDFAALASAEERDVLAQWSGLGYYRRARQLWATARQVHTEYGGKLPAVAATLKTLPGIGDYTSKAVASIAFGAREAVVDGNVKRVISRLYCLETPIDSASTTKTIQAHADTLLNSKRPGDHNQAMMELGATVCTPRQPNCPACPVARHCEARAQGLEQKLPLIAKRAATKNLHGIGCLIRNAKGELLLVGDAPAPLGRAEMFELPVLWERDETTVLQTMQQRYGLLRPTIASKLKSVAHAITVHRMKIDLLLVRAETAATLPEARWVATSALKDLPVSGLVLKAARRLAAL